MEEEKISSIVEKKGEALESFDWKKAVPLFFGVLLVGAGIFVAMESPAQLNPQPGQNDPGEDSNQDQQLERTEYQQNYVDCPDQYLAACTALSKMPTVSVSFLNGDDDKLCVKRHDNNRTMVGKLEMANDTYQLDYQITVNSDSCPI